MAKMRAIDAAVRVLEKEGITCAFGVPGAAINPLYSASVTLEIFVCFDLSDVPLRQATVVTFGFTVDSQL